MTTTANVDKVKTRRRGAHVGEPGQLDRYDDGSWEFFGNDETTPEEVAQKIIGYEQGEQNEDYKLLRAAPLAQVLLEHKDNAALAKSQGANVRGPIPRGKSFVAEAPTLKSLVAQLVVHEKALREQLQQQPGPSKADKTLGTVRGGGLTLPYE